MPPYVLDRPVWRRFPGHRQLARAAEHVRRGGHAAVVLGGGQVDLLLTVGAAGKISELGLWSLLAIEQERWRRVRSGAAKGLASARVRPDYVEAVFDWCDRDAVHEGPTRTVRLDCLECAACCHDANVVLENRDLGRWTEAGRDELCGKGYVKRSRDGRTTLRFADTGRCQHLRRDRTCRIYELRPDNCRVFVVGSEACLAAREETLGLRDGR